MAHRDRDAFIRGERRRGQHSVANVDARHQEEFFGSSPVADVRAFIVLLVALLGCPASMHPMTHDCQSAIRAFASADPAQLGSLPSSCTLGDLSAVLESLPDETTAELGTQPVTVTVRYFRSAKLLQIRAWLSSDRVMLLDAESPPSTADAYLHALGTPEGSFDYPWEHVALKDAELVWPTRGVVLVSSPRVRGVVRIGIFPPTSLATYLLTTRLKTSAHSSED